MTKRSETKKIDETFSDNQSQMAAINRTHCVLELGLDGTIISANNNLLELMGYTLEEIKDEHHQMFLHTGDKNNPEYIKEWESICQGKCSLGESRWFNKNGDEIWLQVFYSLIPGKTRKSSKVLQFMQNITDKKQAQQGELAEHKIITDILNMTTIISHADVTGKITDINKKFVEVSKYSREELIGSQHNITRHPDMPKATFKQVWNTIGHGRIFRGVIKNRAKDGEPYYVDAVIAPIVGSNGKPKKYIGVRYDITELEIERQNMRGILAAIDTSYAYVEFDPSGHVLTANKNFLQLFGYQAKEIIGQHHRLFVEPEDANSHEYSRFWQDLKSGKHQSNSFKRLTKSGEEIWIQAIYTPVKDEMDRVIKILKISTDITAQVLKNLDYHNRVKEYSKLMGYVANGDLRQRIDAKGDDELSVIGHNLDTMIDGLTSITTQIEEASNTLLSASGQIQVTVNTQASGASEQAVAVNQITTTLEQVRATSEQNLKKSKQLGEVSEKARIEGEQGQQALERTINGMNVISEKVDNIAHTILAFSEQSQQIGEITEVVSNIAQQSKMLALNASIEAAKAGDAGKGFAVVAAEVKELAIQSQQSTAQVQKILYDIRRAADRAVMATEEGNRRVGDGVLLVEKSSEMMTQLCEVINETVRASKQIVAAVQQEVIGIDQVTRSMNEIRNVTSQFVNSTQETKQAAMNMGDVAERLKNTISTYKT